jgi:hypothetical protein
MFALSLKWLSSSQDDRLAAGDAGDDDDDDDDDDDIEMDVQGWLMVGKF